jgi:integrase
LRPVEISRLTVAQVDLADRRLTVGGRTVKNRPRDIYLHDEIVNLVRVRVEALPNVPLFRDADSTPETFPVTAWNRSRKAARLSDIPFYALRHTFATWLLETGTRDEETRAVLLGHKLTRMSARYTHVTFTMIREAIERLPRVTPDDAAGASAGDVG